MTGFDSLSSHPMSSSDAPSPGSLIDIVSVSPSVVEDSGGFELRLAGTFLAATVSAVSLVSAGNVVYPCYSAKPGQSYQPIPRNVSTMIVSTPVLPIGTYTLRVSQGSDTVELPASIVVQRRQWHHKVFEVRRVFPPWWSMGARAVDRIDLLRTDLAIGNIPTPQAASVGVPFTLQTLANNPLGVTRTWSSVGTLLPLWLTLNSATGALTGTPAGGDVGTTTGLKIRVSDGSQIADSNIFVLTVTA